MWIRRLVWHMSLLLLCAGCSAARPDLGTDISAAPAAISPDLWQQLNAALSQSLAARNTSGTRSLEDSQFIVKDFAAERAGLYDISVSWSYRNPGDYDQNGEVNSADLVYLARYFGRTSASPDWPAAALADGNGNGLIEIGDVSAIGQNYRNAVSGYYVMVEWTDYDHNNALQISDLTTMGMIGVKAMEGAHAFPQFSTGPVFDYPYDPDHTLIGPSTGEGQPGPWLPIFPERIDEGAVPAGGGALKFSEQLAVTAHAGPPYASYDGLRIAIFPYYEAVPGSGELKFGKRGNFLRVPSL